MDGRGEPGSGSSHSLSPPPRGGGVGPAKMACSGPELKTGDKMTCLDREKVIRGLLRWGGGGGDGGDGGLGGNGEEGMNGRGREPVGGSSHSLYQFIARVGRDLPLPGKRREMGWGVLNLLAHPHSQKHVEIKWNRESLSHPLYPLLGFDPLPMPVWKPPNLKIQTKKMKPRRNFFRRITLQ